MTEVALATSVAKGVLLAFGDKIGGENVTEHSSTGREEIDYDKSKVLQCPEILVLVPVFSGRMLGIISTGLGFNKLRDDAVINPFTKKAVRKNKSWGES